MDFCQLVAHCPFELPHPQLSSGRECHVSTSCCMKSHLVLLSLNVASITRGYQVMTVSRYYLSPFFLSPQTFCRTFSDLCFIISFPVQRVIDYSFTCPDHLNPKPPPRHPLPVAQRLHLSEAGTPMHALGCQLAGSSRSWMASDGEECGSWGDPSADRGLADQAQSHHVGARLAERARQ